MPEYLAPGVFVEEVSFRAKSIEGVGTTTTGFVGPTRYGPLDIEPEIVTSLVEFERTYGGKERLQFSDPADVQFGTDVDNHMWHAARAFFEEGGSRLYVSRVFSPAGITPATATAAEIEEAIAVACSRASVGGSPGGLNVRARFPGRAGDARVRFTLNVGQNVLVDEDPTGGTRPGVRSLRDRDVVLILDGTGPAGSPPTPPVPRGFFVAHRDEQQLDPLLAWTFTPGDANDSPATSLGDLVPVTTEVRVITIAVAVDPFAEGAVSYTERDIPLDPQHRRGDTPDSLFDVFAPHTRDSGDADARFIANLTRARTVPIVVENLAGFTNGIEVLNAFLGDAAAPASPPFSLQSAIESLSEVAAERSLDLVLTGGNDGVRPQASAYEGEVNPVTDQKTGLRQFEDLEDISIVAAPGSTYGYESDDYGPQARTIVRQLINHAQRMRYRIAVLDSGDDQSIGQVRGDAGAARLEVRRPLLPLGARARSDHPARDRPAAQRLRRRHLCAQRHQPRGLQGAGQRSGEPGAGLRDALNKSQQEVLNPEGINCFRFFEGRGIRLWGARTISSDPEWKYVNLRRYFAYLERSIDKGTQWAVFEPNGEPLWANVRRTIEDFLLNEWQNGALLGDKPEKAYFVQLRPLHHDAERPRQRPPDLPDRRRAAAPGRVRHLPHRPVDGGPQRLT